jgi:hypothetical protein
MYPAADELSKSFLENYLAGLTLDMGPSNPFRGMSQENNGSSLIAQGRVGSIPPMSITSGADRSLLGLGLGGPGAEKVSYGQQEYGLYGENREKPGYAPAGVTLWGGRRGQNPGPGIKGIMGRESYGYNVRDEEQLRTPLDRVQLQLRKMGVPGM